MVAVYFENKTWRRELSNQQLELHLNWLTNDDILLVFTPRKSDMIVIKTINNDKTRFCTWTEVANELRKENDPIANQFLDYGRLSIKDHAIPFKNDQPEVCVFFDVHPDKKELLKKDRNFELILKN